MKAVLGAILLAVTLGGCAQLRPVQAPETRGDDAALAFMARLAGADGAELERIGRSLEPPPDAEAEPARALRHALWQGTPGHPGYDPGAARERLRALLGTPSALSGEQRDLARIQRAHIDRLMQMRRANVDLSAANRELREQIEALTDLESEMGEDGTNDE